MQRPILATVSFASPFEVLMPRPLALKPRDRKAPDLGPKAPVESVHLSSPGNEKGLEAIINGAGLEDTDKDGLREHGIAAEQMWQGDCPPGLTIEFNLAEPATLSAIEVYNFNNPWQNPSGLRKADVAVSSDGSTWQTVLRNVEFAEGAGNADYDEPIVLKLNHVAARKVRFENLVPWKDGKVGLSEVVFHQAPGQQASLRSAENDTK